MTVRMKALFVRPTFLKTDRRNFAGDSTTDGCWRENYAGNHEGWRHTDKSKNKAVVAVLEISSCLGVIER